MSEQHPAEPELTLLQETALYSLCERCEVTYDPSHYDHTFDPPEGWVAGWIGGPELQQTRRTLYVGCSPEGEIHR